MKNLALMGAEREHSSRLVGGESREGGDAGVPAGGSFSRETKFIFRYFYFLKRMRHVRGSAVRRDGVEY